LQEYDEEGENDSEEAVIGFGSGFVWLVIMTVFIAILSEYVVDTQGRTYIGAYCGLGHSGIFIFNRYIGICIYVFVNCYSINTYYC
jgi:hypothetical protein